jgi:hypothetical protein
MNSGGKLPEWQSDNPDFIPWEEEEEEVPYEDLEDEDLEEDL